MTPKQKKSKAMVKAILEAVNDKELQREITNDVRKIMKQTTAVKKKKGKSPNTKVG